GDVIVINNTTPGAAPEANIWIRKGGTYNQAMLSGTYFASGFSKRLGQLQGNIPAVGNRLPDPKGLNGLSGTVVFNGDGTGTANDIQNLDGVITGGAGGFTYSVAADGGLTVESGTGGVIDGGSIVVIHNVTPLMDPEADVWIEQEN